MIFPLLQLSNVRAYSQSILVKLFKGGKDVFYRLKSNDRIWSHFSNSSMLSFKGLFLGYHDGKSFYGLDFSLHWFSVRQPTWVIGTSY